MKSILGIDEAGRGSILGPMVVAGVLIDDAQAEFLKNSSVKDSKKFGSGSGAEAMRKKIAEIILANCICFKIELAFVPEINQSQNLNILESKLADRIIASIKQSHPGDFDIVCDGEAPFKGLLKLYPGLITENKAEDKYPCVAAASILAKVERDFQMNLIYAKYEKSFDLKSGKGYVNDDTMAFIEKFHKERKCFPEEVRTGWKNLDYLKKSTQKTLFDL